MYIVHCTFMYVLNVNVIFILLTFSVNMFTINTRNIIIITITSSTNKKKTNLGAIFPPMYLFYSHVRSIFSIELLLLCYSHVRCISLNKSFRCPACTEQSSMKIEMIIFAHHLTQSSLSRTLQSQILI